VPEPLATQHDAVFSSPLVVGLSFAPVGITHIAASDGVPNPPLLLKGIFGPEELDDFVVLLLAGQIGQIALVANVSTANSGAFLGDEVLRTVIHGHEAHGSLSVGESPTGRTPVTRRLVLDDDIAGVLIDDQALLGCVS
jgi:hypothetical protein